MKKIINKYNEMTKEEKIKLAKKVTIGVSIGITGILIGQSLKKKQYETDVMYLNENLDCLESDNFELEKIIDRQTLKIKENIDTINNLKQDVIERDLSIMELVDGDTNKYRGIRGSIWKSSEELINNSDRIDRETIKAKKEYDNYVRELV